MKFNINNGNELQIDLENYNHPANNYLTTIIDETDSSYIISDVDKNEVSIPKEIISINEIQVVDNKIRLTDNLYRHCFGEIINKKKAVVDKSNTKDLLENFAKLIRHKDLVLNHGEYFLIRHDIFASGSTLTGGIVNCLGGILESWFYSNELILSNFENQGDLYLLNTRGSPLSGSHAAFFWSSSKNEFVSLSTEKYPEILPGGFITWFNKLKDISNRYPYVMDQNHLAIRALLNQLSKLP